MYKCVYTLSGTFLWYNIILWSYLVFLNTPNDPMRQTLMNSIAKIRQLGLRNNLPPWLEFDVHPLSWIPIQSSFFPSPTYLSTESLAMQVCCWPDKWHQWHVPVCTIRLLRGRHSICVILFSAPISQWCGDSITLRKSSAMQRQVPHSHPSKRRLEIWTQINATPEVLALSQHPARALVLSPSDTSWG